MGFLFKTYALQMLLNINTTKDSEKKEGLNYGIRISFDWLGQKDGTYFRF